MLEGKFLINGEWKKGNNYFEVLHKYTNKVIAKFPIGTKEDLNLSIESALEGFKEIKKLPSYTKADLLYKVAEELEKNQEDITLSIIQESGKPYKYASGEVRRAITTFKCASYEVSQIHGETVPIDLSVGSEKRMGYYIRVPLGIIGAITPFNFPLNLVAHKVAPALASGNSFILKPASFTPITSYKLINILLKVGFPKKAINLIYGSGSTIGIELVKDPRINKITFTGSLEVGQKIQREAGIKKITLELGSNSGVIIEEDANIDYAVKRCVFGSFAYSGQVCISVQRIYIAEKIYKKVMEKMKNLTESLKIGNPEEKDTDIGPMISEKEAIRIEEWVQEAKDKGARIIIGGKREGNIYYPTILTEVDPSLKIVKKEAFGPIVCLFPYKNFEEALKELNNSQYGLQAGIFTNNINKILTFIKEAEVGGVIINDVCSYRSDPMPYGGVKMSGLGREGLKYAIEDMTERKMIVLNQIN